jgi:predicted HAD superfamily Cof-like phosphohydrolase
VTDIREMMNDEQKARLNDEPAWTNTKRVMGFPLGATAFQMTGHFHQVMGLPAPEEPILPPVSMRERRLRLITEELQELIEACGFEISVDPLNRKLSVQHVEGSRYDVVEAADALGDLNVVVAGTGVEFGIPMHFIDYEVYTSNLSKLNPATGKPIVNHCQRCGPNEENIYYSSCACDSEEFWLKPGVPIGKILKPDSFVPTNIPRVLLAYQDKEI